MFRFSCADYTFPLLPRAERFSLLKLLGFHYVDVGLFERNEGLQPSRLATAPRAFTRKLKSELARCNLRVSDVFLQTSPDPSVAALNNPNRKVRSQNRSRFKLGLDLCKALDCTHMTGLPGVRHRGAKLADDVARAVEEASWRMKTAAAAGVCYSIEPHVGSLCADIRNTRRFLDAVPGLTLTLDYGHFVYAGARSQAVHSLLPFASHVHARGGATRRLQTSVEENQIDFAGMVRLLHERSYKRFIAIEYVWTDWKQCNSTDNVSETILLHRSLTRAAMSFQ
jgi:sugar phosphate isomerase/epimerase